MTPAEAAVIRDRLHKYECYGDYTMEGDLDTLAEDIIIDCIAAAKPQWVYVLTEQLGDSAVTAGVYSTLREAKAAAPSDIQWNKPWREHSGSHYMVWYSVKHNGEYWEVERFKMGEAHEQ